MLVPSSQPLYYILSSFLQKNVVTAPFLLLMCAITIRALDHSVSLAQTAAQSLRLCNAAA